MLQKFTFIFITFSPLNQKANIVFWSILAGRMLMIHTDVFFKEIKLIHSVQIIELIIWLK